MGGKFTESLAVERGSTGYTEGKKTPGKSNLQKPTEGCINPHVLVPFEREPGRKRRQKHGLAVS